MMRLSPSSLRALGLAVAGMGSVVALGMSGAFGLSATACSSTPTGGGTSAMNPAGPPILLGASVPETGKLDGNKRAMAGGLVAAAEQVNALGGILGRQVNVVMQDDQSSTTQALTVAQSLFGMQASALIGPVSSGQVTAIESFIQSKELVTVSSTATSVELSGECTKAPSTTCPTGGNYASGKSFFFRTVPSDSLQAVAVGIFALRGPNGDAGTGRCTKMDIVHTNDSYGEPLSAGIVDYMTKHGGAIPSDGNIAVDANQDDNFTGNVTTVFKDLPDCLVLAVYPPTAGAFMAALTTELMMGTPTGWSKDFFVIGTDGTYDPSLIADGLENMDKPDGPSFVNGTIGPPMYGTVAATNNPTRPQYNELVSLYQAEVGFQDGATDLDPYTSNQYDAAILSLLAMEAAGTTTDASAIQKAMFNVSAGKTSNAATYGPLEVGDAIKALRSGNDINYQGASGNVDFDAYGNVIADFLVWKVVGQGFKNYDSISSTLLMEAE
jgi:ABC-type branched-subunit amino acid transport system substrate-binding protein